MILLKTTNLQYKVQNSPLYIAVSTGAGLCPTHSLFAFSTDIHILTDTEKLIDFSENYLHELIAKFSIQSKNES